MTNDELGTIFSCEIHQCRAENKFWCLVAEKMTLFQILPRCSTRFIQGCRWSTPDNIAPRVANSAAIVSFRPNGAVTCLMVTNSPVLLQPRNMAFIRLRSRINIFVFLCAGEKINWTPGISKWMGVISPARQWHFYFPIKELNDLLAKMLLSVTCYFTSISICWKLSAITDIVISFLVKIREEVSI